MENIVEEELEVWARKKRKERVSNCVYNGIVYLVPLCLIAGFLGKLKRHSEVTNKAKVSKNE